MITNENKKLLMHCCHSFPYYQYPSTASLCQIFVQIQSYACSVCNERLYEEEIKNLLRQFIKDYGTNRCAHCNINGSNFIKCKKCASFWCFQNCKNLILNGRKAICLICKENLTVPRNFISMQSKAQESNEAENIKFEEFKIDRVCSDGCRFNDDLVPVCADCGVLKFDWNHAVKFLCQKCKVFPVTNNTQICGICS